MTRTSIPRGACGIYRIKCVANGKEYIGSSSDIRRRIGAHRSALAGGYHPNRKLSAAWEKYGASAFVFEVVSQCEEHLLLAAEQAAIDAGDTVRRGFNLALCVEAPMRGKVHTDEARRRISAAQAGKLVSDATRKRMSEAARSRGVITSAQMVERWSAGRAEIVAKVAKANTGKKRTAEACANIGAATKRKWESPEFRAKITEAWERRRAAGVKEETREKLSEATRKRWVSGELSAAHNAAHRGRKNSPETIEKMRAAALARHARKRAERAEQAD